jgi:hypothetical protein
MRRYTPAWTVSKHEACPIHHQLWGGLPPLIAQKLEQEIIVPFTSTPADIATARDAPITGFFECAVHRHIVDHGK